MLLALVVVYYVRINTDNVEGGIWSPVGRFVQLHFIFRSLPRLYER